MSEPLPPIGSSSSSDACPWIKPKYGTKLALPAQDCSLNLFELQILSDLRHYPSSFARVERFLLKDDESYDTVNAFLQKLRVSSGEHAMKPTIFNPKVQTTQRGISPDLLVLFENEADSDELTVWLRSQCTQFVGNHSEGKVEAFIAPAASLVLAEITMSGEAYVGGKLLQLEKTMVGIREGCIAEVFNQELSCLGCIFLNSTETDFQAAVQKVKKIMEDLGNLIDNG